jgi:DNA-binding transcriptional LysR family regulator
MDLEELRAFLDVVETGSFLAAAKSLGVSRTTLRRRVEALEARAGVPLLKSTPQGILLTEAGEVLAQRGRIMMQESTWSGEEPRARWRSCRNTSSSPGRPRERTRASGPRSGGPPSRSSQRSSPRTST